MDRQDGSQIRLMVVDLDRLVPEDHLLRRIRERVEFDFIYGKVRHLYKVGGRPSIDPVMLVKMWLIGYLYDIRSERRLEQEVHLNLAYRWLLGLDLEQRVPDHSTLSANRNGRFKGKNLFVDVFDGIVEQCKKAGLVDSESVVTDSSLIRANASTQHKEWATVSKTPREYLRLLEAEAERLDAEQSQKRGRARKTAPPGSYRPKLKPVPRSRTDPDAMRSGRPGTPEGFYYLAHVTTEPEHGIILDVEATKADVNDHEPYIDCIRRAKRRHNFGNAAADAGYDYVEVHRGLADLGVTSYIPAVKHMSDMYEGSHFTFEDFTYKPETDSYCCPAGRQIEFRNVDLKEMKKIYAAKHRESRLCALRDRCLPRSMAYRKLKRAIHQECIQEAHARVGSPLYRTLQRLRRTWCEGTFSTLKARHCLARAIRRGLDNMQEQLHWAATALNLKRWATAT